MSSQRPEDTKEIDPQGELDPLMASYNPLPPKAEPPARFYWQEPWQDASAGKSVQAAFES